jgi:hypothetical protein
MARDYPHEVAVFWDEGYRWARERYHAGERPATP